MVRRRKKNLLQNSEVKVIAIDAMGGDFAPREIISGVLEYVQTGGSAKLCVFGPKNELQSLANEQQVTIVDTHEIIGMGDEPVKAVREKRDSSLVKAIESVAKEECMAVISAGNSGAMMAAALFFIGREKGVERPALIGLLPSSEKPVVCLDLGANPDCKAKHLHQFAHLGVRYAQNIVGIKNPTVGLLSNGEEPTKGSLLTKEAFLMFEQDKKIQFVGNVEPWHIFKNKADVVVCDGFAGNVLLKTVEAVARIEECKKLRRAQHGGALLIGIKKPVVVMHGNSTAKDVIHAIAFTEKIIESLERT
jgi:glycerol-3-phosphate acyltransferase PlsX